MPVPNSSIPTLHRLFLARLACVLLLATVPAFARGNEPSLRIPLENVGFQPLSTQFLLNGSSMLTLHYVDDKHLLITFVVHRLIPRMVDEPEDDQDRFVEAVLLELPNGHVLARTTWHLHDHAQYLWALGHGHFILRVRDTLTTIAPLANLATKEPFVQHPFLTSPGRRIAALILSPETDLLIIETIKRLPPDPKPKTPIFGPAPAPPTPQLTERNRVQVNFYRLRPSDDGGPVQRTSAGVVETTNVGDVPATTAGYLAVVDQGRQHWAFDFHSYAGKTAELSPFDSSCRPAPIFVSHSEFIAFGCRTTQSRQQIGGFNMRGEEMWEQGLFGGDYIAPSLVYAPAGGRFALSRIMLRNSAVPDQPISTDEVVGQTVVVYQTGTGKQLAHADCSPVSRAGQNFALSPDGMALAVVHAEAIEIYNLPPLTKKDEEAINLAKSLAPPENDLPVNFSNQPSSASTDADNVERAGPQPLTPATAASVPPNAPQNTPPNAPSEASQPALFSQPIDPAPAQSAPATPPPPSQSTGDPAPEQRRAPPTLYNQPGDKPPANPKDTPQ